MHFLIQKNTSQKYLKACTRKNVSVKMHHKNKSLQMSSEELRYFDTVKKLLNSELRLKSIILKGPIFENFLETLQERFLNFRKLSDKGITKVHWK